MKKFTVSALLFTSLAAHANPSANDMQTCQALLTFLDQKLTTTESYAPEQVAVVLTGLSGYDAHIQDDIITPALLVHTKGNAEQAQALQAQVDEYKGTLVLGLEQRFPALEVTSDLVLAVNNCAKKSVPGGQALVELQAAVTTMAQWTGLIR